MEDINKFKIPEDELLDIIKKDKNILMIEKSEEV